MIRAQKLKSGFSAIGVFIGVTFLIGAWSIVNGMNRYMTDKFAGTLVGVNTFHLRRRPNVNFNVEDSVWRAWRRRPRIKFADADAVTLGLRVPVVTAWYSEDRGSVEYHAVTTRSEEHTSELQSQSNLVCRLLLEKKKQKHKTSYYTTA